jgi:DNA-binding CsgD family transcriptional regulator
LPTSSGNGGNDARRTSRQPHDVARSLKRTGEPHNALEHALHWLADGVALLSADGTVVFANDSFHAMAGRNDGIGLKKGAIEFADAATREKFNRAVRAALRSGEVASVAPADFIAARAAGGRPYLASVRALLPQRGEPRQGRAVIMVFLRDPAARGGAADAAALRDLFGFTDAEATLAAALQSGVTLAIYARARGLSLNTAYTHLRRLREKTGSKRMAELIGKFDALRLPLLPAP